MILLPLQNVTIDIRLDAKFHVKVTVLIYIKYIILEAFSSYNIKYILMACPYRKHFNSSVRQYPFQGFLFEINLISHSVISLSCIDSFINSYLQHFSSTAHLLRNLLISNITMFSSHLSSTSHTFHLQFSFNIDTA